MVCYFFTIVDDDYWSIVISTVFQLLAADGLSPYSRQLLSPHWLDRVLSVTLLFFKEGGGTISCKKGSPSEGKRYLFLLNYLAVVHHEASFTNDNNHQTGQVFEHLSTIVKLSASLSPMITIIPCQEPSVDQQ